MHECTYLHAMHSTIVSNEFRLFYYFLSARDLSIKVLSYMAYDEYLIGTVEGTAEWPLGLKNNA